MVAEKVRRLIAAIEAAGYEVAELKEEYERKLSNEGALRTEYGYKTGAILLRITPEEV